MPKRLAITISGAVSLGSYEAGVLYEVIEAIGQHNGHADTVANPDQRIEIDVLTGASAGGMTATIAAQKLLYDGAALEGPDQNAFYRPWVLDVSLDALLQLDVGENTTHSIFSSNLIEDIARKYLTSRYAAGTPARHRHPACAARLSLGVAISNLNGVTYTKRLRTGNTFAYTRHQDRVTTTLTDGNDNATLWEFLRVAAVASGAFPLAFRVRDLLRKFADYPGADPFAADEQLFTYTDGGVFENEPLGMAKELVDEIDDHQDSDSRFYLFVAPGARLGTEKLDFHEQDANFVATLQRTAAAVFEQSRFHDWIRAEEVNDRIAIFNRSACGLKSSLITGTLTVGILQPAATALLKLIFASHGGDEDDERDRLSLQFQKESADITAAKGPAAAAAFLDTLLAFETAAHLGGRDEMNIYGIVAADSELASSAVSAFAGFFDQSYRQHDYDVGRAKARKFLTGPTLAQQGQLGPIRYENPKPLRDIDPALNGLLLENMDRDIREQFRDRILDRSDDILKELGFDGVLHGGKLARFAVKKLIIKPKLDALLKL